jgi:hypothetical protein
MPLADTSRSQVYYLEESEWGVTPAEALKEMRFTGESLKFKIDTTKSNEIRDDRQIADLIQVNAGAEGGINFELSAGCIDDLIEGALMSVWEGDTIVNGVAMKSFTVEKKFGDVTQFLTYRGMMVNDFNLDFAPGSILTGSFGFLGKAATRAAVTAGSGAPTAAPIGTVLNGVGNISAILEGGSTLTAKISKFTLALKNNLRSQSAIGTLGAIGVGSGRIDVSGGLTVYFENGALYDKFLAATASSFSLTASVDGDGYIITLPAIKWTDGNIVAGGADQDVMVELGYQAIRDSVTGHTISIERIT